MSMRPPTIAPSRCGTSTPGMALLTSRKGRVSTCLPRNGCASGRAGPTSANYGQMWGTCSPADTSAGVRKTCPCSRGTAITILAMRLLAATLLLGLSLPTLAQVPPDLTACAKDKNAKACGVSKNELAEGKKEFAHGLKLRRQRDLAGALAAFERAADLVPRDVEYATAREIVR